MVVLLCQLILFLFLKIATILAFILYHALLYRFRMLPESLRQPISTSDNLAKALQDHNISAHLKW